MALPRNAVMEEVREPVNHSQVDIALARFIATLLFLSGGFFTEENQSHLS